MTKRRSVPLRPLDDYDFPWMPQYIDELQSIAAVLGNELFGAFMRVRAYAWLQKPRCTVPDDDRLLARISGLGPSWGEHGDTIRELLTPAEGGRLRDVALTIRYAEQAVRSDISQARKFAGKTGGEHSAESRRPATGKQPAKQPASKIGPVLDRVIGSVVSSKDLKNLEPGEATGEATGQATGAPVVTASYGRPLADWRTLVDPARAAAHARAAGNADTPDIPPTPSQPEEAAHDTPDDVTDVDAGAPVPAGSDGAHAPTP